jgi:hypothetical protein
MSNDLHDELVLSVSRVHNLAKSLEAAEDSLYGDDNYYPNSELLAHLIGAIESLQTSIENGQ